MTTLTLDITARAAGGNAVRTASGNAVRTASGNAAGAAGGNDRLELIALVRAAQRGDRQAFGELFERFERHVMAIALRRMSDFGEAQELCQDVFIQAMKKIR
ncbi:MAG: hypothetical protein JF612_00880, partial [Planctomycetia bacterium]|nr:hypothetical protein [Planctomycetia bacterium]